MSSRKLESINGIENCKKLKVLDFSYCTKLQKLSCIPLKVTRIELTACKRINNLNFLSNLIFLNELLIENCGELESIIPLEKCYLLEKLSIIGTTKIIDLNLNGLLKLKKLNFLALVRNNKYRPTEKHVRDVLSLW